MYSSRNRYSHKQQDYPSGSVTVINSHTNAGKTSSILAGLEHIPGNFHILAISAVDQPRKSEIYQQLISAHANNPTLITAPTYQGKMGHPILWGNHMRSHLQNIREETLGLRQIIQEFYSDIHQVEFDCADILLDINTPEVYQKHLLL